LNRLDNIKSANLAQTLLSPGALLFLKLPPPGDGLGHGSAMRRRLKLENGIKATVIDDKGSFK